MTNPPWIHDSHPELWVPIALAAKFYFKKSRTTLKRMIKSGLLDEIGMPYYWDGYKWFIRLPNSVHDSQLDQPVRRRA